MSLNIPVSVIIVAYNEVESIEAEIKNICDKILQKLPGSELIIAEDGSTDGTKEIIQKYVMEKGVIHVTSDERKGYATALKDALLTANKPYIFFSDTGNKFDFDEFWTLYRVCDRNDLVIGVRTNRDDQFYRRVLTFSYNTILNWYFNVNIKDSDCGFRIYSMRIIHKIANETWINKYLIGSELALRTAYSGGIIGQVPVSYSQRSSISRGLPPSKIPRVIINVLNNFKKLKNELSSPFYHKL